MTDEEAKALGLWWLARMGGWQIGMVATGGGVDRLSYEDYHCPESWRGQVLVVRDYGGGMALCADLDYQDDPYPQWVAEPPKAWPDFREPKTIKAAGGVAALLVALALLVAP